MKIRIRGNSIRLRLSQPEVNQLSEGRTVQEICLLSPAERLICALEPWHLAVFSASSEAGAISVRVPLEQVQTWATSADEGIYGEQENGSSQPLRIAIEKDYSCPVDRPGEDQSQTFPHPEGSDRVC